MSRLPGGIQKLVVVRGAQVASQHNMIPQVTVLSIERHRLRKAQLLLTSSPPPTSYHLAVFISVRERGSLVKCTKGERGFEINVQR